jgi:hypothetical protein
MVACLLAWRPSWGVLAWLLAVLAVASYPQGKLKKVASGY